MLNDLRYAVRSLFRQPSFAVGSIATLALGIGAATAIFSVFNSVLLRPLPFPEPDRIVAVTNYWTRTGTRSLNVSAPDFHDWKAQSRSFAAFGYYSGGESSVTVGNSADYAGTYIVSPGFFEALSARPVAGRLFGTDDYTPGAPPAVVISDGFWARQFNRAPSAVGSTVKFDDAMFTIVGVIAPGQNFPLRGEIFAPSWLVEETPSRSGHNYRTVARLRDGVSLEQARQEMTAIATRLEQLYPNSNGGKLATVVPLQELLVGSTRQTLYVLLGAVLLVLLIACANVANLLLARSSVRAREMVVRAAVGASRYRLVRQLLTESAVLGLLAGVAGVWLARLGVLALLAVAPANTPRIDEVHVDATALLFALAIALAASALFGVVPALHASRVHLGDGLRQGGKGSSTGSRTGWARSAFVVAEVALAVVLVVGAGLLSRSLAALSSVDLGFDADRLLVAQTAVPIRSREDAPRATAFYRDLLSDLRALPGVDSIAGVTSLPTAVRSNGSYWIEGGPSREETGVRAPQALFTVATPDYFRTMRVPIRAGRDFNDGDRMGAPMVAIINESLARATFPGQDPLGHRIQCGLDNLAFMTIVGVVGDVRTSGPSTPPQPEIYMPYEQHPGPASSLNLVARTSVEDPLALSETVRRDIARRNPDVPMKATTMAATLTTASSTPRFQAFLLVVFAAVALLLALAGVYGVMAYTVSRRIPELGVRIALGAPPERIMGLILGQGARLAAAGLAVGLALALASGRLLEGMLFGVTSRDPIILVAVTAGIALATVLACYIPGRRAMRVDPIVALRAD